jgi:hypothetical protein
LKKDSANVDTLLSQKEKDIKNAKGGSISKERKNILKKIHYFTILRPNVYPRSKDKPI